MAPHTLHMHAAIEVAGKHKTPFGAALSMGDEIFVTAANQTAELHDPTAHAEVMAIRKLGQHLQKTNLSGFTLYTTCEPCPMCMGAAIWAKIDAVFYGCDIPLIAKYMDQINMRADNIAGYSITDIQVRGGILTKECEILLKNHA